MRPRSETATVGGSRDGGGRYCFSPPEAVTLDIDDTVDVAHGHQQLSFFNAYYEEYCFLPIHVYDTERSLPVAVVLRPGRVPKGTDVRAHLRRLVRHIRSRWPTTRITFRGDTHYACPEAMEFCQQNGLGLHPFLEIATVR